LEHWQLGSFAADDDDDDDDDDDEDEWRMKLRPSAINKWGNDI
jgi:hypothetical protein